VEEVEREEEEEEEELAAALSASFGFSVADDAAAPFFGSRGPREFQHT
jgi:hypothetical protein